MTLDAFGKDMVATALKAMPREGRATYAADTVEMRMRSGLIVRRRERSVPLLQRGRDREGLRDVAVQAGINKRFRYLPTLGGFVLLTAGASNLYFLTTSQ